MNCKPRWSIAKTTPGSWGPLNFYGWGWDIKLPFGWWLVWSRSGHPLWVYVSNDATPPDNPNVRGFFLYGSRNFHRS
jgi:hypothetical protein